MNNFANERLKTALHRVFFWLQRDFSKVKRATSSVEESGEGKCPSRLASLGTISALQDKGFNSREDMMQYFFKSWFLIFSPFRVFTFSRPYVNSRPLNIIGYRL